MFLRNADTPTFGTTTQKNTTVIFTVMRTADLTNRRICEELKAITEEILRNAILAFT
jgi:hypothetical protein